MAKKHKSTKRPLDPDEVWAENDIDPADVLAICERIRVKIEEHQSEVSEAGLSVFNDIGAKAASIGETIATTRRVSPRQKSALLNWEAALDKWLPKTKDAIDG